jgi:integrase
MTLTTLLRDFYAPLRSLSDRTILVYGFTIDAFGDFLGHEPTVADLEELTVARFLAHRVRQRAAATAAKDRAQLRALWEFAARRKLSDTWPLMPVVRVPERVPEAWLTEEFQRLLDSAAQEKTNYDGIPAAAFWRALLLACYDTGERVTSVMLTRWRNVQGKAILFAAENRKGRRRDILREISEETQAALDQIRCSRSANDLVWPWPRSWTYLWTRLEIILKRAGLPHDRKDKFHKIRKSTASYYRAAGGDAQQLLDHANPTTTRRYLDPRIVKGLSAPDVLPKVS